MANAGKNQSYARFKNNELVLNLLRKKEYSATELSKELGLSNAALSQIMSELSEKKLVRQVPCGDRTTLGRRRNYFSLNGDYGIIVAVGFSDNEIHIAFADFSGKLLLD